MEHEPVHYSCQPKPVSLFLLLLSPLPHNFVPGLFSQEEEV